MTIQSFLILSIFFFLKMLSTSKPRVNTWPELQQFPAAAAAAPVKLINVTGSKTSSSFARLKTKSESESDVDGYVPVPAFNQSFGDAIAMALEKAALGNDDEDKGQFLTIINNFFLNLYVFFKIFWNVDFLLDF